MAKITKKSNKRAVGPKIKTIQLSMEKKLKEDSSRHRLKKIDKLVKNASKNDLPMDSLKKAIELLGEELRKFALKAYRGKAYYAFKAIENGIYILQLKESFYSLPKEDREGVKWSEICEQYFDHMGSSTCQECMRLAKTPRVHQFAPCGFSILRDMRRTHKRLGEAKFDKFIRKHNLDLEDNQDVPLTEFKKRIKDILIAEGHIKGKNAN